MPQIYRQHITLCLYHRKCLHCIVALQITARMGHWEANPMRASYMSDYRADGLLALGGWPGEIFGSMMYAGAHVLQM